MNKKIVIVGAGVAGINAATKTAVGLTGFTYIYYK